MNPIYQIGASAAGMADLPSLGLPYPKADPVDYSRYITLGDGSERGCGWLKTTWRFAALTLAQLTILKAFCTGSSATVYIETLARGGVYTRYSATMVWPKGELPKAGNILDFAIEFRKLVAL